MDRKLKDFIADLERRINEELPGIPSQMRMATIRRTMRDGKMEIPPDARQAGVMILIYQSGKELFIPLIKRNEYPGVHSGQISFPGGGREKADQDIIATALRETEEEIGVDRSRITCIGTISNLFIPPSNFVVTPVIGYLKEKPVFKPDPSEVQRILEVPLETLLNPETIQEKVITLFPEVRLSVPCFYVQENVIWGATAMMLNELVDLINR